MTLAFSIEQIFVAPTTASSKAARATRSIFGFRCKRCVIGWRRASLPFRYSRGSPNVEPDSVRAHHDVEPATSSFLQRGRNLPAPSKHCARTQGSRKGLHFLAQRSRPRSGLTLKSMRVVLLAATDQSKTAFRASAFGIVFVIKGVPWLGHRGRRQQMCSRPGQIALCRPQPVDDAKHLAHDLWGGPPPDGPGSPGEDLSNVGFWHAMSPENTFTAA